MNWDKNVNLIDFDSEIDGSSNPDKNEIIISNLYSNNQKIKPVISSDWLTSISLKSY